MKQIIISFLIVINLNLVEAQQNGLNPNDITTQRFEHPSFDSFRSFLAANLFYPPEALQIGVSGVLLAGFNLSEDGEIIQVFCLNSLHAEIDNQVLDLFEKSEQYWKPSIDSTKNAKSINVFIPIVFTYKGAEFKIDSQNSKYKLLDEIIVKAMGVNNPKYPSTTKLIRNLNKYMDKDQFSESVAIIDELLKREPLNTEYYNKKIETEIKLGESATACQYVQFVKQLLINPIDKTIIDLAECK